MEALQIVSWLSKSACDTQILTSLLELKEILSKRIDEEDKKILFEKYPDLKKVIDYLNENLFS